MVLGRDVLCRHCGERASVEMDHIVPLAKGGRDDLANLQGLCRDCHRIKTRRDWLPSKIVGPDGREITEIAQRKREFARNRRGKGRSPMRIR